MPELPSQSQKTDSINISSGAQGESISEIYTTGGKWEDEEERKFYEDLQDLRDCVPKSMLGLDDKDGMEGGESTADKEKERKDLEELDVKELEEELRRLELDESAGGGNATSPNGEPGNSTNDEGIVDDEE
jgi:regulator of nonsense transcripts 2